MIIMMMISKVDNTAEPLDACGSWQRTDGQRVGAHRRSKQPEESELNEIQAGRYPLRNQIKSTTSTVQAVPGLWFHVFYFPAECSTPGATGGLLCVYSEPQMPGRAGPRSQRLEGKHACACIMTLTWMAVQLTLASLCFESKRSAAQRGRRSVAVGLGDRAWGMTKGCSNSRCSQRSFRCETRERQRLMQTVCANNSPSSASEKARVMVKARGNRGEESYADDDAKDAKVLRPLQSLSEPDRADHALSQNNPRQNNSSQKHNLRISEEGMLPMAAVPTPDQIAYAMLMGQYCRVTVKRENDEQ